MNIVMKNSPRYSGKTLKLKMDILEYLVDNDGKIISGVLDIVLICHCSSQVDMYKKFFKRLGVNFTAIITVNQFLNRTSGCYLPESFKIFIDEPFILLKNDEDKLFDWIHQNKDRCYIDIYGTGTKREKERESFEDYIL